MYFSRGVNGGWGEWGIRMGGGWVYVPSWALGGPGGAWGPKIRVFWVFWGQGGALGLSWASLSSLSWVTSIPVVPCGIARKRSLRPTYGKLAMGLNNIIIL